MHSNIVILGSLPRLYIFSQEDQIRKMVDDNELNKNSQNIIYSNFTYTVP